MLNLDIFSGVFLFYLIINFIKFMYSLVDQRLVQEVIEKT